MATPVQYTWSLEENVIRTYWAKAFGKPFTVEHVFYLLQQADQHPSADVCALVKVYMSDQGDVCKEWLDSCDTATVNSFHPAVIKILGDVIQSYMEKTPYSGSGLRSWEESLLWRKRFDAAYCI